MDIMENHVYRAKKPQPVDLDGSPVYNDRSVLWVSSRHVQYDSPHIQAGRFPRVRREQFEKWAGEDVTEGYPEGWAEWTIR